MGASPPLLITLGFESEEPLIKKEKINKIAN
jgi:hypothetical protein